MISRPQRRRRFALVIATLAVAGCHDASSTTRFSRSATAVTPPASQPTSQPSSQPTSRPWPPASPVIHPDGTVTFRVLAPRVQSAEIWGDWPKPDGGVMTRDDNGIWSLTLGPIPHGYWAYQFKLDGQYGTDRANPIYKPSREVTASILDLPGDAEWDRRDGVPHGVVHLHDYASTSLHRTRRLRVYTPPGYDADPTARYPVLYLLHGSGDNESTWSEFGRANVILDNLIAEKSATPMIVVMTDGHAVGGGQANSRDSNVDAFGTELLGQVMPMIEASYRTRAKPDSRAIAGLSMGGNQALIIGLHHPERFAWVGGMSSAIREPERDLGDALTAGDGKAMSGFRLIWISCGVEDRFLDINRHIDALLTQSHVAHEYNETPGKHAWPVWRQNLITLAPKLFWPTSRPAEAAMAPATTKP